MANQLTFTKMQGVGNDFVVVDGRGAPDFDWPALAIELCDRRRGIGADGLLVLDDGPFVDVTMRMYNPDGTPDVCGNGLRCVARYASEQGIVSGDTLRIGTLAGARKAHLHRDDFGRIASVTVGMGQPRFNPIDIPMRVENLLVMDYPLQLGEGRELLITALSTGSTHAVTFCDALPDDNLFFTIGPLVEHHPLFPERTSLMWCLRKGEDRLRLRIWERGAGETWGCGTGACAAAVAAVQHGYAAPGAPVHVVSQGGELIVRWKPGEEIRLTGPAERVYEGHYRLDLNAGKTRG